jgi:arabinofuranan 3-O-arabinosyltransferase
VELEICADGATTGRLSEGEHRFAALSTDAFAVRSATLLRTGAVTPPAGREAAAVEQWDREHRRVAVGGRTEPTLLVVPENVNPGWVATLDGRELETRTVDGWQQGYVLPAGPAGEVALEFRAGTVFHAALAAGAVAVLVLLALVVLPARGTQPPPGRGRSTAWLVSLGAVAGIALVGGGVGLALLAATAALARAVRARRRRVLAGLAATSLLAAGAVQLTLPGVAVQVLALLAVSAVVVSMLDGDRRAGTVGPAAPAGRGTEEGA